MCVCVNVCRHGGGEEMDLGVYVCVCTSPSLLTMTSMSGCLLASFIWLVRGASDTFLFLSFDSIGVHLFFISEVFPVQQQHQGMKEDDEDIPQWNAMRTSRVCNVDIHAHTHKTKKKKAQTLHPKLLKFPHGDSNPGLERFPRRVSSYTENLIY